jgi:DinB superfamily
MKNILLFIFCTLLAFAGNTQTSITKKERKAATKALKASEKNLEKAIQGLAAAQFDFTPGGDAWGVGDCVKHLAASEGGLRQMLDASLAAPANPEKRSEVKMSDAEFTAMMTSRENKVKTFAALEPKNTSFKSVEEAMAAFKAQRAQLIEMVKTDNSDMRNHVSALPFGSIDAYQMILLIAGHTNRHVAQIEEVKANAAFPK